MAVEYTNTLTFTCDRCGRHHVSHIKELPPRWAKLELAESPTTDAILRTTAQDWCDTCADKLFAFVGLERARDVAEVIQ